MIQPTIDEMRTALNSTEADPCKIRKLYYEQNPCSFCGKFDSQPYLKPFEDTVCEDCFKNAKSYYEKVKETSRNTQFNRKAPY